MDVASEVIGFLHAARPRPEFGEQAGYSMPASRHRRLTALAAIEARLADDADLTACRLLVVDGDGCIAA
jgi:hypothetical protein